MFPKPICSAFLWDLKAKKENKITYPDTIYDIPNNSAPASVKEGSGDKVEALEALEALVQVELRKKHLYLTRVKSTYKLKKIIFHTQIQRNRNRKKGYPENHNLGLRSIKKSTI